MAAAAAIIRRPASQVRSSGPPVWYVPRNATTAYTRLPTAKTTTPGSTRAAVALGNTVRRSIWISTIQSTMIPPVDHPMLAIRPSTEPPASNTGSSRNS